MYGKGDLWRTGYIITEATSDPRGMSGLCMDIVKSKFNGVVGINIFSKVNGLYLTALSLY
jgi:hypothetical protein